MKLTVRYPAHHMIIFLIHIRECSNGTAIGCHFAAYEIRFLVYNVNTIVLTFCLLLFLYPTE